MGTLCRQFLTATATVLFLIVPASLFPQVDSSGIFELDLVSFENREGRDSSGVCCGGARPRPDGSCPLACSPLHLRVCVTHYQATVIPNNPCTFHEYLSPPLDNRTDAAPPLLLDLGAQPRMVFNLDFMWPGEFSLIIEAWHTSDKTGSSAKTLVSRFIAQRSLKVSRDWSGDRLSADRSVLEVRYRVYCAEHYYGSKCETLCRQRDDNFGHYSCREDGQKLCLHGWSGAYCDKVVCLKGCVNGTCDKPDECKCRHGWEGMYCNICIRYPGCMHGTCTKPWQCNCDEGWGGLFCDQDLNYCTNNKPCRNGGTCTNTGQGSYTCDCAGEYMGKDCDQLQNPCKNNPCKNDGKCQNPEAGKFKCECSPGFFGRHCETSANICTHSLCENGGLCIPDPEGFICKCLPGFSGVHCEKAVCKEDYCLNGGTCIEHSDGLYCQCPQGLKGDHCENISACSYNTCKNRGTCTEHSGSFKCICTPGFSGTHCQTRKRDCSSKPCANGGACRDLGDDYHCDCKAGFSGKDCVLHSDPCSSSPCLNGGSCHAKANSFVCHCHNGYHGMHCQLKEVVLPDWDGRPAIASNVSHHVADEDAVHLSGKQVALIASLSSILPLLAVFCCAIICVLKRRRRASELRSKECELEAEDEQLQNERNAMHMNNKCNMPQKIVNTLDRMPAKVSNEAPPKVLNIEVSNKKVPDKSLVCAQRTFQKKDNNSGSSVSCHQTQEWPPCNSGGIYVIEDHFRSRPSEPESGLEDDDILATEV